MPARRMRSNRLPVAPPPLRHRVHSPSGAPRESSLDRVRRLAREHRAEERPFDPEKRGSWRGSSRDLVVNPSHRKGPRSHFDPDDADFLFIEEDENDRHPFVVVNPTEYDGFREPKLFAFGFGAYGNTKLLVWHDSIDDALEIASEWLADHAPGVLTTFEEEGTIVYDYMQEHPSTDEETAQQEAMQDFTYTEVGWIPSWEMTVSEISRGELFDVTLEASKEEYEQQYGEAAP